MKPCSFQTIRERFNNISFILLIGVGLFALIFTSIKIENLVLNKAILEWELLLNQDARTFFQDKQQSQKNILLFAEKIPEIQFAIFYNAKNQIISGFNLPEKETDSFYPFLKADLKSIPSYEAESLNLTLSFQNGTTLLISRPLPQEIKIEIWKNQLLTIFFVVLAASSIYFTYHKLFVCVIADNIYNYQQQIRRSIKNIV